MNYKPTIKEGIIFLISILLLSVSASAETIYVTGKVVDSYGPVADAYVKFVDAKNGGCETGSCISDNSTDDETDASGYFEISISPDYNKKYNITISKDDYETKIVRITLNSTSQNQSIGEIEIIGIAKVEGIIIDEETGRVIEKAEVTITDKGDKTNDGGRFLIENVTAEKWTLIIVEHRDYEEQKFLYNITPGDNSFEIKLSKMYVKDYAVSAYTNYPSLIIGAGETKEFKINCSVAARMSPSCCSKNVTLLFCAMF